MRVTSPTGGCFHPFRCWMFYWKRCSQARQLSSQLEVEAGENEALRARVRVLEEGNEMRLGEPYKYSSLQVIPANFVSVHSILELR